MQYLAIFCKEDYYRSVHYTWEKTQRIGELLVTIEINRALIENLPAFPQFEKRLQRESLLKSSLFSARIEGNTLTIAEIENTGTVKNDSRKKEVFNIIKALRYGNRIKRNLSLHHVKEIHAIIMQGVGSVPGVFRTEPSAIFNQAGIAVYLTPPPAKILPLLQNLLDYMNTPHDDPFPVQAAIAHFWFEKIHPFLDRNGRTGRVLAAYHLKRLGYAMRELVSIEEYFDTHRSVYYEGLAADGKNVTDFVEFFLEGIVDASNSVITQLKEKKADPQDFLLPRRSEILASIQDHPMITFDQIRRRFLKVSERTLHYDLAILMEKGFIKKHGATRGAVYSSRRE